MIRRIKFVLPVLQEQWKKRFYIDTIKALKPTKLIYEDLGKEFSLQVVITTESFKISSKGDNVIFILHGSIDSKECVCENKQTGKFYGISSWDVSKQLHANEHAVWEKESNTKMVQHMSYPETITED